MASEQIRQAVLEAKRRGLPITISMGGVAASGGYWVSTAGDHISPSRTPSPARSHLRDPADLRIGAGQIGVTADGVRTNAAVGQPDLFAGTTPELDAILQANIENGYREFIGRVAQARRMTPARVDEIGQGRVWDGGTARQIGLVDQVWRPVGRDRYAARQAKLDPAKVHAVYLEKEPGWLARFAGSVADRDDDSSSPAGDSFARIAAERRGLVAQALGDARRLAMGGSVQAGCLECGGIGPSLSQAQDARLLDLILARVGL